MLTKEFVTLKLDEITPYENNPRINDDAVDDVIASIQQCENLDPIEIDENNVVLSGHTRLKALKKLANTGTQSGKTATKEELQSAISELKRSAERDLTNYISRGRRTHETNNTYKEIRKRWLDRITTRANGRSGDSTTY